MNVNQYPIRSTTGFTGSVHQSTASSGGQMGTDALGKKWGDTTTRTGEVSRVFVGSVPYNTTNCLEIEQRFAKYGTITGIDINPKNFAFVQFERVDDACHACQCENQTFFRSKKIDVRMFDKSGHPTKGRIPRERSRSPLPRPGGDGRMRGGPTGTRHGSFLQNQFDDSYGPGPYGAPPPPTAESMIGNEAEIIVTHKELWSFADMVEKRIKGETGVQTIDMLFLHSPTSLNVTLNDLFERQTLYAVVISHVNEEHRSVTLHVLHNQTEHRNMPLEDALQLIKKDLQAFTGRPAPYTPPTALVPPSNFASRPNPTLSSLNTSADIKMPENVSYLLRTILSENGSQFLTLQQMDLLIDYFQNQKTIKLSTKATPSVGTGDVKPSFQSELEKQKASLFDNPHVQAAFASLMQIGAINANTGAVNASNVNASTALTNQSSAGYPNPVSYGTQSQRNGSIGQTLRHPLFGTELTSKSQSSMTGGSRGLVGYPAPHTYNQYNSSYQY